MCEEEERQEEGVGSRGDAAARVVGCRKTFSSSRKCSRRSSLYSSRLLAVAVAVAVAVAGGGRRG